jgi:hypothetical protein
MDEGKGGRGEIIGSVLPIAVPDFFIKLRVHLKLHKCKFQIM